MPDSSSAVNLNVKGTAIKDLIEPLLLFFVIFFAPVRTGTPFAEITHSILFRVPAFLLVIGRTGQKDTLFRFARKDIVCCALAFPSLALISFSLSLAARFSGLFPGVPVNAPGTAAAWLAAVLSSFSSGCLEESYFRVYLITRLQEAGMGIKESAAVSAVLFSFCHFYEGPWGIANSAAAALILSALFLKYRSFYGLALAHGLYNTAVYLFTAWNTPSFPR